MLSFSSVQEFNLFSILHFCHSRPFFLFYFILNLSITVLDENTYLTYTRRKLGLTMHSQTKLLFHQLGKGFQEFQTISKLVSGRFQLTENGLLDSRFV